MIQKIVRKTLWGLFFAFFEKFVAPILTSGGLAAVSSSAFAALYNTEFKLRFAVNHFFFTMQRFLKNEIP